jgi:hypothetical protein
MIIADKITRKDVLMKLINLLEELVLTVLATGAPVTGVA